MNTIKISLLLFAFCQDSQQLPQWNFVWQYPDYPSNNYYPDYPANNYYPAYPDYPTGGIQSSGAGGCQNLIFRTITNEGKNAILDRHNELRSKVAYGQEGWQPAAANMRKMYWSNELEEIAQRWADKCRSEHSQEPGLGENLAWKFNSQQQDQAAVEQGLVDGVQDWYDEVNQFNSGNIEPYTFDYATGHYSQVVWAETDEVGCGMVYYKEDGWFKSSLVCNYRVAGNMQGGQMYQVGNACSSCQAGYGCQDGLCIY